MTTTTQNAGRFARPSLLGWAALAITATAGQSTAQTACGPSATLHAIRVVSAAAFGAPADSPPLPPAQHVQPAGRSMLDDLFPHLHERKDLWRYAPNGWILFGFGGQFLFFMRFVVQWYASEKRKRVTVPVAFWYISIVGSLTIFIYALHRRDIVFMTAQLLACLIYVRNLMLIYRRRAHAADRRARRRVAVLDEAAPPANP